MVWGRAQNRPHPGATIVAGVLRMSFAQAPIPPEAAQRVDPEARIERSDISVRIDNGPWRRPRNSSIVARDEKNVIFWPLPGTAGIPCRPNPPGTGDFDSGDALKLPVAFFIRGIRVEANRRRSRDWWAGWHPVLERGFSHADGAVQTWEERIL